MKEKAIFIIILIIVALVLKSLAEKISKENEHETVNTLNERELQELVYLENQIHKEKEADYDVMGTKEKNYQSLYPDLYVENIIPFENDVQRKTAYLSFDDGPSQNTFKILDTLKEQNIKASFFIIADGITETGEECLLRMEQEGHAIGIHSYCHKANIIYRSIDDYLDDFNKAYTRLREIVNTDICMFRFPWGSYNKYLKPMKDEVIEELDRRGFTYIDWNVSGDDSIGNPTKRSILRSIKKDLDRYDYPVILLHDSPGNELTAEVLSDVIALLKEKGYEFGTLYERAAYQFNW